MRRGRPVRNVVGDRELVNGREQSKKEQESREELTPLRAIPARKRRYASCTTHGVVEGSSF